MACSRKAYMDELAANYELASINARGNDVTQEVYCCRKCDGQWHIGAKKEKA